MSTTSTNEENPINRDVATGIFSSGQHLDEASVVDSVNSLNKYNGAAITVDPNIGESIAFGESMKKLLDVASKNWNENALKTLLNTMKRVSFDLDVLIKNSLGYAVKDIKKIATLKKSNEILSITSGLIEKWKGLQKRSTLNTNGKRDHPEGSSASAKKPFRPAIDNDASAKLAISKEPPVRLAISKEPPPVRPKAVNDINFFSSFKQSTTANKSNYFSTSRQSSALPTARSVHTVDTILENIEKGNEKPKKQMSPAVIAANAASALDLPPSHSATSSSLRSANTPQNRRRVQFKEDLVEIREYEPNPEEWTSFGDTEDYGTGSAHDLDVREGRQAFMQQMPRIPWYTPFELNINKDFKADVVIESHEAQAQEDREKHVLAAIYISPQHIPPSPAEPDEIPNPNIEGTVPIIPLEDVETMPTTTSLPSAVPNASMLAPTFQNTTAQSYNIPNSAYNTFLTTPSVISSSSDNQYHRGVPSDPAPTNTNTMEISGQDVEAMLQRHPDIMQSLKQLQFLAGPPPPKPAPQHQRQQKPLQRVRNGERGNGGRVCKYYKTEQGCMFGDRCHNIHK